LIEQTVHETLTYYGFPDIDWEKIQTNNPLERIMKEIRRRARVVGAFPDGQSCMPCEPPGSRITSRSRLGSTSPPART
jgi:transposase-like protein